MELHRPLQWKQLRDGRKDKIWNEDKDLRWGEGGREEATWWKEGVDSKKEEISENLRQW